MNQVRNIVNVIHNMKTSILDELDLPEERRAALSREAMRLNKPVNLLLKEFLLQKADAILAAANGQQPIRKAA